MIIKVCGMTDADNIREVESLGVDMMGFIFFEKSPRFVGHKAPSYMPACSRVGVFVNPSISYVESMVNEFGLSHVQLHGEETPEFCSNLMVTCPSVKIIKAFSISNVADVAKSYEYDGLAEYFLFDTATKAYGGSGKQFSWDLLETYAGTTPFLLSGGIGTESIGDILRFRHPRWCGVDLNSRFETKPGVKDAASLDTFIAKLKGTTEK